MGTIEAEIRELIDRIQDGCGRDIKERLLRNPKAKVYLVLTTYGYDIRISVKVGEEWRTEAELPPEVLDVIYAKFKINAKKDEELVVSGNQLYIGFNGDPFLLKKETEEKMKKSIALFDYIKKSQSLAIQIIRFLDITNLFKEKLSVKENK